MNIKIRLSLQFTLLVGSILLFFSALIYYFSYSSQIGKFRQNLLDTAKNTAILLINVTEVDSSLLKKIQQSTISLDKEEVALTDSAFNLIYSNNIKYFLDHRILTNSARGNINYFSVYEKDGVYYRHIFKHHTYNVFIAAFDKSRTSDLAELRKILLWSILFSLWLSVLLSYLFAKRAIRPISKIIKSVREINIRRLNHRLNEGDRKDEIAQLAITFNEMLSDLEIAFRNQEDFVSNASHELRTPLTVMISESDYILIRKRTKEEYINHITSLISDLKRLNTLINSLLEMAQINKYKGIVFSNVRIDEIVFNVIQQLRSKYTGRKIIPKINYSENENEFVISGNAGILEIAFKNLIDNAIKFSSEEIEIDFTTTDEYLRIEVSDKGIGIPSDEIDNVLKPFNRASNVKYIGGFGIGLSLVSTIFNLHKATFKIISAENKGTHFEVNFKKV